MDVVLERCAGIDVAKDEVVACVRTPGPGGRGRRKETRTFLSFTGELEAMAEWFAAEGVKEVVMEATGSYWKPVWYVLEDRGFELKLVNARHVKIVPGRKCDVLDAEWLAELLEHGCWRRRCLHIGRHVSVCMSRHCEHGQRLNVGLLSIST